MPIIESMVRLGSDLLLVLVASQGHARRRRLQPRLARSRLPAHRRSAGGGGRSDAGGDLRTAARVPVGRAGQHDRDAARQRPRRGGCRSIRSTVRRANRRPRCCAASTSWSSTCRTSARASTPTSTRWPTACAPARGMRIPVIVCDRPNPIGGVDVEGARARAGIRVVRRPVPDSDAPRHDDRRAGAALQRGTSRSAPSSRS